ncbi:unnamed protein product (macronuclear) [Paramecium tetraurelia]|uniref:Uncharacterized protein n=1 Tax=Paramecium tetraurelia TaxID=5888 RepID=A0C7S9_PARTE|nr:uncharacterized protein GSPATT00035977001 [Paramecium tetraurelia]CAK66846.1 unnamed protein product [Paramecium tetraurelia]|eukprot:XP_001434243.1 hypothetical protein (macronuclear) [Paramecium tetraurelia strain d4-2]
MEISGFLYDNLPQPQENHEQISEDCHLYRTKSKYIKSIFRIQSPDPSIQEDCFSNGNDQSFEIGQGEFQYVSEEKNSNKKEQFKGFTKRAQKTKKLEKKRKLKNGPLSETEFIDIMKKLEQCQQVMNMIDNMVTILNQFKGSVQQQTTQS